MTVNVMLDWPELLATIVLIIGFAFALFSGNAVTLYLICFLTGLLFGRLWFKVRMSHCIPLFLTIMAFFLGFILGGIWANLRIIAIVLLAGILIGYWLHAKKIIRSF